MQIHELNAFTGTLESAYLAIDDGIESLVYLPAFQYVLRFLMRLVTDTVRVGARRGAGCRLFAQLSGQGVPLTAGDVGA